MRNRDATRQGGMTWDTPNVRMVSYHDDAMGQAFMKIAVQDHP